MYETTTDADSCGTPDLMHRSIILHGVSHLALVFFGVTGAKTFHESVFPMPLWRVLQAKTGQKVTSL